MEFSIKVRMPKITIFLLFSNFPFSYKDSNQKVLMSDMLTTTSELIPTANVYSRHRILYKSTHAGNRDMFAVPGSPGVGSGQFPINILLKKPLGICFREPRGRIRAISCDFLLITRKNLLPGAPGPDLENFLFIFY